MHRKQRTPLDSFCQLLMEASLPELDSSPLPRTCETIINIIIYSCVGNTVPCDNN